jgi:uridylate kinase
VVKLGGPTFPSPPDVEKILGYAKVFLKLKEKGHRLIIATGGGENARSYVEAIRKLGATETVCDEMGIACTRLNAKLMISALKENAYPYTPTNTSEVSVAMESGKIIVLGGLNPGHSTDAVAAIVSELFKASILIKATDSDGIFTEDPKKNPSAKKLDTITSKKLLNMILQTSLNAGEYELFDPVAVKIIDRSRIPTFVVDGKDPTNIEKIVRRELTGTRIIPSSLGQ